MNFGVEMSEIFRFKVFLETGSCNSSRRENPATNEGEGEYSSTLTEYTERRLTASGIFNGIFYYLKIFSYGVNYSILVPGSACAWAARVAVPWPARGTSEIFSKNMGMFMGLSRPRWYIQIPQLSNV